jgi:glycine betaine/proline transport system permease protein
MNDSLKEFFDLIPLGDWIGDGISVAINWLVDNASTFFNAIRWPIARVLDGVEGVLLWLPWPLVVLLVVALGWYNAGRWVGIGSGIGLIIVGFLGYWDLTMVTMGMILTALAFCVIVGVPLGILAAKNDTFENTVRPMLDGMQTIHPFVYLIPIVMFFGIGKVPGTMATIIFALPPIVRLTNLGIRQVPSEVVEAGRAFGSNGRQLLFDVQIPLALPTIMAGLNQTLMLALSMVVIVALIAGGGLGQEIYGAVTSLQIGRAITSGLAVLILAIVLDRISQVRGVDRSAV